MAVLDSTRPSYGLHDSCITSFQGWARDVKARDRDALLPQPRHSLHQPRRDV